MIDMLDADVVEFTVDQTGKIWVNVNGACALRIGHAKIICTEDLMDGSRCVHNDEVTKRFAET